LKKYIYIVSYMKRIYSFIPQIPKQIQNPLGSFSLWRNNTIVWKDSFPEGKETAVK
jgi:hypothetical protein